MRNVLFDRIELDLNICISAFQDNAWVSVKGFKTQYFPTYTTQHSPLSTNLFIIANNGKKLVFLLFVMQTYIYGLKNHKGLGMLWCGGWQMQCVMKHAIFYIT